MYRLPTTNFCCWIIPSVHTILHGALRADETPFSSSLQFQCCRISSNWPKKSFTRRLSSPATLALISSELIGPGGDGTAPNISSRVTVRSKKSVSFLAHGRHHLDNTPSCALARGHRSLSHPRSRPKDNSLLLR